MVVVVVGLWRGQGVGQGLGCRGAGRAHRWPLAPGRQLAPSCVVAIAVAVVVMAKVIMVVVVVGLWRGKGVGQGLGCRGAGRARRWPLVGGQAARALLRSGLSRTHAGC